MTLQELIAKLERAERVERIYDGEIGGILGWRRKVEYVRTSEQGEPIKRVFWIVPSGNDPGTVPMFTTSVDAAVELMNTIAPSEVWGVSFADGKGTAVVGGGPYCHAPTPAMALCIAALKAKLLRDAVSQV
ncbi:MULTISPECIES: hypothetical protein [Sinorhizobium]|uniref:hypothetical protein n=1 Tax=Sinorhizobium TaxID=28105 RepID=UPI000FD9A6E3|nr:hypothetical protein [Sinorhizobium medicae]MDW9551605.1 hypothetical protein [Sinorhizobium meliloti]MDW9620383.1 hypothetical protein [Sinorhizobium meliloti]MDX0178066.1 hypothetical protein [Sinorhizobium meliloti]RVJ77718.1 hypothetical protein CN168_19390 [Sinorhizobium medicae]